MIRETTFIQGETSIVNEEAQAKGEGKDKTKPIKTIQPDSTENDQVKAEEKRKKLEKKKQNVSITLAGLTKDTEERSKSIEQTNQRTQMATATSMFIVHVGILRTVVNSDDVQYYDIQVGLVVTALILQLIAGLLAIYIAVVKQYYTEHRGDVTEDCVKICFPCSCIPVQTWNRQKMQCSNIDIWLQDDTKEAHHAPEIEADHPTIRCCPYHCLCHQYEPEEREVLNVHQRWQEDMIKSKLRAVMCDDEEENRDMLDLQGEILGGYVQEIRRNKILRRATFWQNVMALVVFFVFVLNALFTGFGLIKLGG